MINAARGFKSVVFGSKVLCRTYPCKQPGDMVLARIRRSSRVHCMNPVKLNNSLS